MSHSNNNGGYGAKMDESSALFMHLATANRIDAVSTSGARSMALPHAPMVQFLGGLD